MAKNIKKIKPIILAYENGGDWADAGVDYMVNISDKTGKELFSIYNSNGGFEGNNKKHFAEWCILQGHCREPLDSELEILDEDRY